LQSQRHSSEEGRTNGLLDARIGPTLSVFVDWRRRLLAMGRSEARRLGLRWDTVRDWKRSLRRNGGLRGDALARLKKALLAG
jgi:hypothetical protein